MKKVTVAGIFFLKFKTFSVGPGPSSLETASDPEVQPALPPLNAHQSKMLPSSLWLVLLLYVCVRRCCSSDWKAREKGNLSRCALARC